MQALVVVRFERAEDASAMAAAADITGRPFAVIPEDDPAYEVIKRVTTPGRGITVEEQDGDAWVMRSA